MTTNKDQEGREIIKTQKEFFERFIDQQNNIEARYVRLQFDLDLSSKNIKESLGKVNIVDSVFEKSISLGKSTISGNTYFTKSTILGDASFSRVTFSGIAVFANVKFTGKAYFIYSTFSKRADFKESIFFRTAFFLGVTFSGYTYFRRAKFNENQVANFSLATFSRKTIFEGAKFLGETKFEGVTFSEYVQFKNAFIKSANRETFRIIKHEFLKINNRIDALDYHKREMKAYWRDLFQKKTKKRLPLHQWIIRLIKDFTPKKRKFFCYRLIKIFPKHIPDKGILIFNWISTNYGTNWIQGIGFTLVTAFIFYFAFLSLSNAPWSLEAYFRFLNPAHSYEFLQEFNPCDWAYMVDAFGRVFIGFGYYQTIQAFRKYKRI